MLSAAHVLAMDAKNLLDVVDSIRVRFPNLVFPKQPSLPTSPIQKQPPASSLTSSASSSVVLTSSINSSSSISNSTVPSSGATPTSSFQQQQHFSFDLQQSATVGDCYQNLQPKQIFHSHSSPPSSLTHSYETSQAQLYSNQQSGIYDNDCVVNDNKPKKPMIAAKPPAAALVSHKLKSTNPFPQSGSQLIGDELLNEPLKIVEEPTELYSNTTTTTSGGCIPSGNIVVSSSSSNSVSLMSSSSSSGAIKLPEPVSCTIVQENLLASNNQKIMANKLG